MTIYFTVRVSALILLALTNEQPYLNIAWFQLHDLSEQMLTTTIPITTVAVDNNELHLL